MKFIVLATTPTEKGQEWWDSQTPEDQKAYLEKHPNSKYGSGKKKPTLTVVPKSKPQPAPAPETSEPESEDTDEAAEKEESTSIIGTKLAPKLDVSNIKIKRLSLGAEDYALAKLAVKEKMKEINLPNIIKVIEKAKKSNSAMGEENAKMLGAAVCMLAAIALVAVFPASAQSIHIIASEVGKEWWLFSEDKENKNKSKDDDGDDSEIKIKIPEFEPRVDEQANEEERAHFNRRVGLDENGNFADENATDDLVDEFVSKKRAIA